MSYVKTIHYTLHQVLTFVIYIFLKCLCQAHDRNAVDDKHWKFLIWFDKLKTCILVEDSDPKHPPLFQISECLNEYLSIYIECVWRQSMSNIMFILTHENDVIHSICKLCVCCFELDHIIARYPRINDDESGSTLPMVGL